MQNVRAIVLCPGPSLKTWLPRLDAICTGASMIIGVNRAIEAYPCDYACSIDPFDHRKEYNAQGNPKRIITLAAKEIHDSQGITMNYGLVLDARVHDFPNEKEIAWTCASSVAAMIAAVIMGANQIHYYGRDMEGVNDFTGDEGLNRHLARWERESLYFDMTQRWLGQKGTSITIY